jgi:mycothiol synthase
MSAISQQATLTSLIRSFHWPDLAGLHSLVHEVGDRSHPSEDHPLEHFEAEFRAPRWNAPRDVSIAVNGAGVVGYSSAFPELNIGRTVVRFGVSVRYRRKGLGLALLNRAVERSRALGARSVHVPATAGDLASGALLQRADFTPVRHFLRMVCGSLPAVSTAARRGFEQRSAVLADAAELAELQNAVFEGTWGYSPLTGDEVAALMALPGRGPERVLLLTESGRPIAYAWTHLFRRGGAWNGTLMMNGVHPAYRRLGLGEMIAAAGVRSLFEAGAVSVDLEVDGTNALAVRMYENLGFRRRGGTFWYERRLK